MSKFKNFFTPTFKKKLKDVVKVSIGGSITFCGIGFYTGNEKFFNHFIMPVFHILDPETAHKLSIISAKYKMVPKFNIEHFSILNTKVAGLSFTNPLGLAAGYDKNGEAVESLFRMGFGFVEVGSVTPEPQPGNDRPRVFRLKSLQGIINRYGFNSDGHEAVYERLIKLKPHQREGILGVNLGKNKTSKDASKDYTLGVKKFGEVADYLVINISSPNTPGLRNLQQKSELEKLISSVTLERNNLNCDTKPPIFFKISPDISNEDKKDIAQVVLDPRYRVDGLIISNTTISRPDADCEFLNEVGGLSGQPLKQLADKSLKDMALLTKGKIPIIGVGGVSTGKDAKEKIYNGASLVQLYTALTYEGPPLVKKILNELHEELEKDGFKDVSEAIGSKL